MPDKSASIELLELNSSLASRIDRFSLNLRKTPKERITVDYLTARRTLVQEYWQEFQTRHNEITILCMDEGKKEEYFTKDVYQLVEENYLSCLSYVSDKLSKLTAIPMYAMPPANQSGSSGSNVNAAVQPPVPNRELKLPPVVIPKFDGSYQNWPPFHDMFRALIHDNRDMPPVHKLHYLKSNLSGEAEHLLRHFQLTAANYEPSWEVLCTRYANKRIQVDTQLKLLYNQPVMRTDDVKSIKSLMDTTMECMHSLQNLGIDTDNWDAFVVYLVSRRFTSDTLQLWEQGLADQREVPKYEELTKFLETRHRTLEAISCTRMKPVKVNSQPNQSSADIQSQSFHVTNDTPSCAKCNESHSIRQCEQFKSLSVSDRCKFAKDRKLCSNCLSNGHSSFKCSSKKRCFTCQKRHHTLLHIVSSLPIVQAKAKVATSSVVQPSITSAASVNSFHTSESRTNDQILLATAMVRIKAYNGCELMVRALLDQGSQSSFVTEDIVQRLRLPRIPIVATITGIGQSGTTRPNGQTQFEVNAHFHENPKLQVSAIILKSITGRIPSVSVTSSAWAHTADLVLADPNYFAAGSIDLLLGADVYGKLLMGDIRQGPTGPIAQKTRLGWVLSGPSSIHNTSNNIIQSNINVLGLVGRLDLDSTLRRFWEQEELSANREHSSEEEHCERFYEETYTRDSSGRFTVRLPFVKEFGQGIILGQSKSKATSRLFSLINRFKREPELRPTYAACMQEYVDLDHMRAVPLVNRVKQSVHQEARPASHCYLGHHAVVKESSSTTRVRVVFDASCKTSSGYSLNDCLLTGPRLQEELWDISLRWRKHQIAITADIAKMYRQIRIHDDDADYQRIIWQPNLDGPMIDYRLHTVTFGISSAPYLAIKSLRKLAQDEEKIFPIASRTILDDFYVDDLLSGADSVDDAIELQTQLIDTLRRGGFELRKWASNNATVVENVPIEFRETSVSMDYNIDRHQSADVLKTLGIYWRPISDEFLFRIQLEPISEKLTKRAILSDISKIFDPIGWVAPVTIRAKIYMQALWLSGLGWDDEISSDLTQPWIEYRRQLPLIESIRIPRWLGTSSEIRNQQIHCFADASTRAFAAVAYLRIVRSDSQILTKLLAAKTKVAPLKPLTLPRLELCGAVLAAQLANRVKKSLKLASVDTVAWTDSSIVLTWLKGHPTNWKTYVANRVVEAHRFIEPQSWRHVVSAENPADLPSRGINPNELGGSDLWWHGPSWLCLPENEWPPNLICRDDSEIERRKITVMHTVCSDEFDELISRCSTYTKLIRSTAYSFRFISNVKAIYQHTPPNRQPLDSHELQRSLEFWIRSTQNRHFAADLDRLSSGQELLSTSKITNLNPFVDRNGILRVGGRLEHADALFDFRHPIILPKKDQFIVLLIANAHRITFHGGAQAVHSYLRRNYWILDARNTIRHQIFRCVRCFRYRSTVRNQLMGQLPISRSNPSSPFVHTGVDYAGPLELKYHSGRGTKSYKGYISVFICMSTRAMHLEVVSDLSTQGFLAAFRRFVSRRGLCSVVYSDCGTNFVGAARTLNDEFQQSKVDNELAELLANDGIEWNFLPPGSPHFGGLWEAGVKSTKFHIRRVLNGSVLTYEELTTVLHQIEAVLNSRPLCPLSSDPDDLEVLTPGHFLIGRPLVSPPEPYNLDINYNRLSRWKRLQHIVQQFWNRWQTEYLSRMQQRPKWLRKQANVGVNDMVLIRDDRLPPLKWMLGRVIEVHPGKDGLVRVATVRTTNGILKRPIVKLSVLPDDDASQTS